MRWFRKKKIAEDLKTVTEVAGDQIAPGAGTFLLVLVGVAAGAAAAYVVSQRHKNKKAASRAALPKSDKSA
jgi:hypothetical protein